MFKCPVEGCDDVFKHKGHMNDHMGYLHDINPKWYPCTVEGCDHKAKKLSQLKNHMAGIHNVNITWYPCTQENCKEKFKRKEGLQKHLASVHDVGDFTCQFCLTKCSCVSEYEDKQGKHEICRSCYNKEVHASSRYEVNMRNYIYTTFPKLKSFVIAADQTIRGEACGRRYRPDLLFADPWTVIHIECDENQHTYSNGYSCEERRISELYDEFPGKRYIVIRWNPNKWEGGIKSFKSRLQRLKECFVEALRIETGPLLRVWYLYYDKSNDSICKNLPIEHKT